MIWWTKCGLPKQGIKKNEYWHMLQHGWSLKTLCWMKEASRQRPHILWFHWCQMSRIGKSRWLVAGGEGALRGDHLWFGVSVWGDEVSSSWSCQWLYNSEYIHSNTFELYVLNGWIVLLCELYVKLFWKTNLTSTSTWFHSTVWEGL